MNNQVTAVVFARNQKLHLIFTVYIRTMAQGIFFFMTVKNQIV